MIISQSAEYALRAAVLLARAGDQSMNTPQLAEASKIPSQYLAKVLQNLRRAGIVTSQRGIGGGFALTRPPRQITILEVVNAIDPVERIHTCPLKLESHGTNLCPLHRKLDDAIATVERTLGGSTLAQIAVVREGATSVCRELGGPETRSSNREGPRSAEEKPKPGK